MGAVKAKAITIATVLTMGLQTDMNRVNKGCRVNREIPPWTLMFTKKSKS